MNLRWNDFIFYYYITTYFWFDWLKVVAKKLFKKHDHQKQAINYEIPNDQYVKSATRLKRGEEEIPQRVNIK